MKRKYTKGSFVGLAALLITFGVIAVFAWKFYLTAKNSESGVETTNLQQDINLINKAQSLKNKMEQNYQKEIAE